MFFEIGAGAKRDGGRGGEEMREVQIVFLEKRKVGNNIWWKKGPVGCHWLPLAAIG